MTVTLQQILDAVANAKETELDLSSVELEEVTASVTARGTELKSAEATAERTANIKNLIAAHALITKEADRRAAVKKENDDLQASLDAMLTPVPPAEPSPAQAPAEPVQVASDAAVTAGALSGGSLASIGSGPSETPKKRPVIMAGAMLNPAATDMSGGQEIGVADIGVRLANAINTRANGYENLVYDYTPDGVAMVAPGSGAIIASADVFNGDREGMLMEGSTSMNTMSLWALTQNLEEADEPTKVLLAAAGFDCGPNDRDFSMPNGWRQDTPFVNAFQKRPLGTMSYEFYRTRTLASLFPATTGQNFGAAIWTDANQQAVNPADSSTWKPENVVDCTQTAVTEVAWAIVAIARWNSFTSLSLLPILDNFQQALNTHRARLVEAKAMAKFSADCFQRTAIAPFGGIAGLLEVCEAVVQDQYWAERLKPETFTLAIPEPFRAVLRTDLRNRGFGNDATNLNAHIDAKIQEAGFPAPVWYLDDYTGRSVALFPAVGSSLTPASVKQLGRQNGAATTWTIFFIPRAHYHIGERPIMNQKALNPGFADARQNAAASMFETAMSLGRQGTVRGIQLELQIRASGVRADLQNYEPTSAVDYSTDITTVDV